jgi:glycosyltransferase involved in cell wall biosynthesis
MSLVSIITVTYNSEKYLEKTIQSVLGQTYSDIEYIIIDGVSTDNTVQIVKKYEKDIDYWISEPDDGIYDAMNKGIQTANGDIIGIINSDDWLEPDAVEKVVEASRNIEEDEFVIHGKITTYGANGNLVSTRKPKQFFCYHLFSTPFKHPAMFVSKALYQRIGLYDEKCGLAADYDLMLRVIESKYTSVFINKVLTNVRLVGISTGNNDQASTKELYQIIKRNTNSNFWALIGILGRKMNKVIAV